MSTTIQISDNVKKSLDKMKIFHRETYNEVITDMMEDNLEMNEKTKKELAEAEKEKSISHEEAKRILGI
jgi:predicted CopG family antitoxin